METDIIYNGSKWAGQKPDDVATLLEVLETECLDPMFEKYGNFATEFVPKRWNEENEKYRGCASFFGNFATYSNAFNIITNDPQLIETLTTAIRANQQRKDYQEARIEYMVEERLKDMARKKFEGRELSIQGLHHWPTSEEGQSEKIKILAELTA